MLELAEKLRATYGKHAIITFVKDDQSRYRTFCDTFAAINDTTPAALHARFRTVTDSKLIWRSLSPIIVASDQQVSHVDLTHDGNYLFRPRIRAWRKYAIVKKATKDGDITGFALDTTHEERENPLFSSAMDFDSECLWIDREERLRLTRSDLVTLSYHLEGLPHREIAELLHVSTKAIEKKVAKLRELVPLLCNCREHGTLHRCAFELGLTEALLRKRDWFDLTPMAFRISTGKVGISLN